jgi:hypothetical protein
MKKLKMDYVATLEQVGFFDDLTTYLAFLRNMKHDFEQNSCVRRSGQVGSKLNRLFGNCKLHILIL